MMALTKARDTLKQSKIRTKIDQIHKKFHYKSLLKDTRQVVHL